MERAGDDENKRRRIEMEKFVRKQIGGGGEREGEKMRLPEMVRVGKRVVGLEGDLVSVGEMSEETGRLRKKKGETERVPEGHVWIEGDDEGSLDSRVVGPVSTRGVSDFAWELMKRTDPTRKCEGKGVLVVWTWK